MTDEISSKSSSIDLEHRARKFLCDKGWTAHKENYADVITGKSRDIDIIAEKIFSSYSELARFDRDPVEIKVRIIAECAYIPSQTYVWFAGKNIDDTKEILHRMGFTEDRIYSMEWGDPISHYVSNNLAVLDWRASHTNILDHELKKSGG